MYLHDYHRAETSNIFMRIVPFLLLVLIFLPVVSPAAAAPLKVGDKVPDLSAFDLQGSIPNLSQHVVVLDFWASWCAPCKASFPVLAELHKTYSDRGLLVLGVGVDEKPGLYD